MAKPVELHSWRKNQPSVAELLLLYRNRSGWTRAELAARLGFQSDRMVRKWENGQALPDGKRLQKLLELYLQTGIFSPAQAQDEALGLWTKVKETYEVQSQRYEIYPLFDKAWFETLVQDVSLAGTGQTAEAHPANRVEALFPSRHNLPLAVNSFIGREEECERVRQLLSQTRLLTLTGPGGCGKTRLALEIARELAGQFKDGVWLVELDKAQDMAGVLAATATVLGLNGPLTLDDLIQKLRDKELWLLLDTCEHLLNECAVLVNKLLRHCPHLKILATSRESLGIEGESVFGLEGLSSPELADLASPDPALLARFEAVQLFNNRASAVLPDFALTEETIPPVARICHRLDGLPFLIELAAPKIEALTLEQLDQRLDHSFHLLKQANPSLPGRHQSFAANLDWTYELLNPAERVFFKLLCFLPAEINLETVRELARKEDVNPLDALDLLDGLVKKSLVKVEKERETVSYHLLNTVRSYGRQKAYGEGF